MCLKRIYVFLFLVQLILATPVFARKPNPKLVEEVLITMKEATRFMVEEVSTNGGYVWHYLPDMSRRWGEMEAYETMIWIQFPGTTTMGHLFLDAYHITGDEYYYDAAEKVARALIWGQLDCGGWNYVIDFAGDRSLKEWYNTIGKNGWRLEEFQHYYGNATFDDDVSSDAAKFLLRMYLEKLDPGYKYPLDKAIDFIIESQYPIGAWPQRYPLKYDFGHHGKPDYSSFYTFNDDVVWENVNFLLQCYQTLGEERLLDPIRRGVNFYILTQQAAPQAGWGQQYTMDIKPSGARTYEPNALLPDYTGKHIRLLIKFYRLTGETKFLTGIPEALDWLESCKLPSNMTENDTYTHPTFVEIGSNKPIFVHRKGSNVVHGYYYYDYNDDKLLGHYRGKCIVNIDQLRLEYKIVKKMTVEEATEGSILLQGRHTGTYSPQELYSHSFSGVGENVPDENSVKKIIASLDKKNRWLVKHVRVSNPYIGDGIKTEPTDEFATTFVGDQTDTSVYDDLGEQEYIEIKTFVNNMITLLNYVANSG